MKFCYIPQVIQELLSVNQEKKEKELFLRSFFDRRSLLGKEQLARQKDLFFKSDNFCVEKSKKLKKSRSENVEKTSPASQT